MIIKPMNNVYDAGDKVVIYKNIRIGDYMGFSNFIAEWSEDMEYLKEKDYVVIEEVDEDGNYVIENGKICITNQEIDGLYTEKYEEKESYQVGDRVVLDKELLDENWFFTDESKELLLDIDYITITEVDFQNNFFCKEVEWVIHNDFVKGLYIDTIELKFHIKMSGNNDDVLHINEDEECKFKPIDADSVNYQTVFEKWEAITLMNKCPFLYKELILNE